MRPIYFLLIFLPIAVAAELLHLPPLVIFAASALAVVPLAGLLGEATEVLAEKIGPRFGGLLNATLGNAAELIITIIAIRAGQLTLVKASLIGSVIGNILLVLGASILLGGLKNGIQKFNRENAGIDATMLILAVIAISVPSIFSVAIEPNKLAVEELSLTTAAVMLVIYGLSILYQFKLKTADGEAPPASHSEHRWNSRVALGILMASVVGIAVMSEFLVGSVEPVTKQLGMSEFFVGIIIIPSIGNVAEHLVAVQVARKDQM
ncbi:MAG: calcium/proton exchanger, partial [Caldilineales bacterium]